MKSLKGILIGAGYFAQFQAEAWKRLEGRFSNRTAGNADVDPTVGKPLLR